MSDEDAEEHKNYKNSGSINDRANSDGGSLMSMELEMMMDVPDD